MRSAPDDTGRRFSRQRLLGVLRNLLVPPSHGGIFYAACIVLRVEGFFSSIDFWRFARHRARSLRVGVSALRVLGIERAMPVSARLADCTSMDPLPKTY